jgi:hypothetical protein
MNGKTLFRLLLGLALIATVALFTACEDDDGSQRVQLVVNNDTHHGLTVTVSGAGQGYIQAYDTGSFSVPVNNNYTVTSDRGHSVSVYVGYVNKSITLK